MQVIFCYFHSLCDISWHCVDCEHYLFAKTWQFVTTSPSLPPSSRFYDVNNVNNELNIVFTLYECIYLALSTNAFDVVNLEQHKRSLIVIIWNDQQRASSPSTSLNIKITTEFNWTITRSRQRATTFPTNLFLLNDFPENWLCFIYLGYLFK